MKKSNKKTPELIQKEANDIPKRPCSLKSKMPANKVIEDPQDESAIASLKKELEEDAERKVRKAFKALKKLKAVYDKIKLNKVEEAGLVSGSVAKKKDQDAAKKAREERLNAAREIAKAQKLIIAMIANELEATEETDLNSAKIKREEKLKAAREKASEMKKKIIQLSETIALEEEAKKNTSQ